MARTTPSSLSVVLPAYCEAGRIGPNIALIRAALAGRQAPLEIIVVDDGSTDATAAEARSAGADVVITSPTNRGKGAAVRTGVLAASGDIVAFTDADLAYHPSQLLNLVAALEGGFAVAIGSRSLDSSTTIRGTGRLRQVASRVFSRCVSVLVGVGYSDSQCGIKAFRGPAATMLFGAARVDGFAFDVEILALAARAGLRTTEVPVSVEYGDESTVRMAWDAPHMAWDLLKVRRWMMTGAYELAPLC